MPRSVDLVVTSVATQLMEATASTATQVSEKVLAQLVEQFDVDASFLRHHAQDAPASVLVAEWRRRTDAADSDPVDLERDGAESVLAQCERDRKPVVTRPDQPNGWIRRSLNQGRSPVSPSLAVAPLVSGDATTGVLGFVKFGARKWKQEEINTLEAVAALFAQLQARIAAEERLRYLAEHDDLTGVHNRRALVAYLTERLTAGSPGPVAVFYLDLDRLKPINDYLGHTAGDWFIRMFAQRLEECAGSQGMIARLGGDEFVVIPHQPMSSDDAEAFAGRLSAMLRDRLTIGGHVISRTVSIGLAVGTPGTDNCADLLRRADEAVLTAKRAGGNQTAVSTDDMSLKRAFRNDIELHLQGDIESEGLLLHYLPEVDLWTGAIVGAEALVRWRHPVWGLLLPDAFIGVAESTNLAAELGRWVMRSACAEFSGWRANGVGQGAMLRINVSPIQLISGNFVESVADTIGEFGIDAESVCLEITERAVVHDIETTRKTLTELKKVGVQIAIDDFGTGYAVLSHLKSLPVDMLKIDAGFVRDVGTDAGDMAIVRAIIGLAEAFGLEVVAEGVETPAAALTLMQHGCHRAQGFLLSRPLPGDAMEALLSARWMPMPFLADRESSSLGPV
ncbi:putative bifunctional diguanylate cyclase/phosphodiesterase [Mycobacterium senriense]|uniref:Bifunctional diguanylate cyclase/phosphodiesterase n=2 Tax=Mycobacterium senriense TaxID=2775496 RepID=A0ABM7SRS3_9MYCO|nr:sensor domain-containing phosphodiesterase [Mycobacterium senriense]BCZ23083.1 bifunctional diguanylate cyclase/phosphodiesterase [Mycobacterium senriense]